MLRGVSLLAVCFSFAGWASPAAAPAPESILFSFPQNKANGHRIAGPVARDASGALYGVFESGGTGCNDSFQPNAGCGTVYKLTTPAGNRTVWKRTVIYRFLGGNDGAHPTGRLLLDASGSLYGATLSGGGTSCSGSFDPGFSGGCGTIFKLTPPGADQTSWSESVIYRFAGASDGAYPNGGLIADSSGALYGTTQRGGAGGGRCEAPLATCGTAFMLSPPTKTRADWKETVLVRFAGNTEGAEPTAPLVADANGVLYGTTHGVVYDSFKEPVGESGTVFSLTPKPDGTYSMSVLTRFDSFKEVPTDDPLILRDNGLSGLTNCETDTPRFNPCNERAHPPPNGSLTGTFYRLSPPASPGGAWNRRVLYRFAAGSGKGDTRDGSFPQGLVTGPARSFYGVIEKGHGALFQLLPPSGPGGDWTRRTIYSFKGIGDADYPRFQLTKDPTGALYGVTRSGSEPEADADYRFGAVYRVVPP